MRLSAYPVTNLKEVPAEAEVISHQLMLRAGLIRRLAAGQYTWLPMGLKVLRKVENIIREEMDRAGALEVLMPTTQPAELWQESGRWGQFGPELLRFKDRHQREFVYGPTHEEVVTDLARRELRSYKQLRVNFYQIQLKFRDEVRPRFGVMRAREFLMKDAYSFHLDEACLQRGYDAMYHAYNAIFTRMRLNFRAVQADTGSIGGTGSQEFHVLADSGEDAIAFSDGDAYAANVEKAEAIAPAMLRAAAAKPIAEVETPRTKTIETLTAFLNCGAHQVLKTLVVDADDGGLVALCLRGDHELNAIKAQKLAGVANPLHLAAPERIVEVIGCEPGFIGPVGLAAKGVRIYADHSALALADFVCGANRKDYHLAGVNWSRDLPEPTAADLRNVVDGDPSPTGTGVLRIARGIEVGHIFQLGQKYSAAMKATVLDAEGKDAVPFMGCYGIGVTRVVAAAIEQNHDERGIIWPDPIAPYQVVVVPLQAAKSPRVKEIAEQLYADLQAAGIDVLLDDRDARPGVKFADAELWGIPHRVVVAERGLEAGTLEYRHRRATDNEAIPLEGALAFLRERLGR